MTTASPSRARGPRSAGRSSPGPSRMPQFLRCLLDYRRRSLDRAKFWNTCAQSDSVPPEVRSFARKQRQREADHRDRLKDLRRELGALDTTRPTADDVVRYALELRAQGNEDAARTTTLRCFLRCWRPDQPPGWLTALRTRSQWFDLVVEESLPARARTAAGIMSGTSVQRRSGRDGFVQLGWAVAVHGL